VERESQGSDVARLRELIEAEFRAAKSALYDPAMVAPHRFIGARYEHIGALQRELIGLTSEEEGLQAVIDISSKVLDTPNQD